MELGLKERAVGMAPAMGAAYGFVPVEKDYKEYDVFRSRIQYLSADKTLWQEVFTPVGVVSAFNSVHAMEVAKKQFPRFALRISVMAANHPLSPSSMAKTMANTKGALLTSVALNRLEGRMP